MEEEEQEQKEKEDKVKQEVMEVGEEEEKIYSLKSFTPKTFY